MTRIVLTKIKNHKSNESNRVSQVRVTNQFSTLTKTLCQSILKNQDIIIYYNILSQINQT